MVVIGWLYRYIYFRSPPDDASKGPDLGVPVGRTRYTIWGSMLGLLFGKPYFGISGSKAERRGNPGGNRLQLHIPVLSAKGLRVGLGARD